MRSRRSGLLFTGALGSALVALIAVAAPAFAGGSWFKTTEAQYAPGDTVTIVGVTTGGQLGWIEDGPFYGYLRVVPLDPATQEQWPVIAPTDLALGALHLERTGRNGYALRATVTFTLPRDLAPGAYNFEYCNDPCTTGLGDLIGGFVYVGVAPPGGAATPVLPRPTIVSTTTSTPATTAVTEPKPEASTPQTDVATGGTGTARASNDRASSTLGGLAVVVALAAGVLITRRRKRYQRTTTG